MSAEHNTEVVDPVVENVRSALVAAGLDDTVIIVPDSVATAATAAAVLGCEVGAIANSLIFECGGEPLLVLASGAARVDTRKLAREHNLAKITRASAEFVLQHAGQPVGGVAPLGHPALPGHRLGQLPRPVGRRWQPSGDALDELRPAPGNNRCDGNSRALAVPGRDLGA